MKNKTFRIIVFVVALTPLLSTAAFATMNASAYITMTNTWITRSGNTVKVNFSIVGNGTMDKIGVKYVYLYEKNGTDWDLVETFDYTDPDYDEIMMDSSIQPYKSVVQEYAALSSRKRSFFIRSILHPISHRLGVKRKGALKARINQKS